jgi:dephospho-CoA kinase
MLVIGVTGMRGSGKSLAARAARSLGLPVVEMRTAVVGLMRKRKIKVTNKSLRLFADAIRKEKGKAVSAKLAIDAIRAKKGATCILVNGIRSADEISEFKKHFDFRLIAMVAPTRTRFERILHRKRKDDPKKYADFQWSERIEQHWGLAKALAEAEYVVANTGSRDECVSNLKLLLKRLSC